ncbi:MAG TPA: fibronectin type III domain-containing protein [Thermoanaerobaculia bacterium]|jgi:hypothetical protein
MFAAARVRVPLLLLYALTTISAGATGRELAPRVITASAYHTTDARVAFARDRFLVVWREQMRDLGSPIMATLSDANGRRRSPRPFPVIGLPAIDDALSMELIGTGDGFTLFWRKPLRGAMMAHLDLDGRVTSVHEIPLPSYADASFEWNGTHFLAVVQLAATYTAKISLFDREGRIVDGGSPVHNYTYQSDIAVSNGAFVAVTAGWDGVFAQTITRGGPGQTWTLEYTGSASATVPRPVHPLAVSISNGDVLVLWSIRGTELVELKAAIVRSDGSVTEKKVVVTSDKPMMPIAALRTGDRYLIAFMTLDAQSNGAISTVLVDANGAAASEPSTASGAVPFSVAASSGSAIFAVNHAGHYPSRVEATVIRGDGQADAPELLSLGFSHQLQPVLGAGGGEVLATFSETTGPQAGTRAVTIDPHGNARAPQYVAPAFLATRESAWNGSHHLVVHRDLTRLMASRIDAAGRVIDTRPIAIPTSHPFGWEPSAAVVWSGSRWLVVWTDGIALHVAEVSRGGIVSDRGTLQVQPPLPAAEGSRTTWPPLLAFDGERLLLVWSESHVPRCSFPPCESADPKIFAAFLARDGMPAGRTVEMGIGDSRNVSLASSGREFLMMHGDRAHIIEEQNNAPHVVATRVLMEWSARPDVTWDGRNYVVALRYYGANWYLAVRRLNRLAQDVAAPRGTSTLGSDQYEAPSIAAPFAGDALIGLQEGTPSDGVRAVVYRELELPQLPAPPSAPRNVAARQLAPGQFEVTWEGAPEGDPELYVIETEANGEWYQLARVAGNQRRAIVDSAVVRVRAFNAGGGSPATERLMRERRRAVR